MSRETDKSGPIPAARKPLFRRFPSLEERLPLRPFVEAPTPVRRLENLGKRLGGELWVKEDDRTCGLYGGNKPRKLEFVIADALAEGADALVTIGGTGTNHGLATLILGRAAGLAVHLVLFEQPETAWVRKNLFLFEHFGAVIHRLPGGVTGLFGDYLKLALRRGARRPYLVPPGGTSALSTLGYVNAVFELKEQIEAGLLPEPARIYAPLGSSGTAAGLALGLRAAGLKSRLVAVPIAAPFFANARAVVRTARASAKLLNKMQTEGETLPLLRPSDFETAEGFDGPGYGVVTEGGRRAIELFEGEEGISLEPTYTGKTAHALVEQAKAGRLAGGPALFWNTYSSVDFSALLPPDIARQLRERGEERFGR